MNRLEIDAQTLQETVNLIVGLFHPLNGFLNEADYRSVAQKMCLSSGAPWTIPVTLDVPEKLFTTLKKGEELKLVHDGKERAAVRIESLFEVDFPSDLKNVFKTDDDAHPGVKKEKARSAFRVGGEVKLLDSRCTKNALNPTETRAHFQKMGWKTVAGFQTRNPVHRGHEHLHRFALERCDGLFINPVTGWKKVGDFSEQAVVAGYRAMIEHYYPKDRVHFQGLCTPMRYAGPREAVFHALIRKNLGCTHFVIGRDHAGVGSYYGTYEAQELARKVLKPEVIKLIMLKEPYYCTTCEESVTEATCAHSATTAKVEISGTLIRKMLQENVHPPKHFMRPEVSAAILALKDGIFVKENA